MKVIYQYLLNIALCFGLLSVSLMVQAESTDDYVSLPIIRDMRDEAQLAEQQHQPILILFSTRRCEFCRFIRQEYLLPRMQNPAYADKILFREIQTESYKYLRDFNGNEIGADKFAMRYKADLIPTLVIINDKGEELVDKIVGITNRAYYDAELDAKINKAVTQVRSNI
ncbi:MAG: hypothetical protein EP315_03710 [Gammaproteobacteria bacterium]|nr:MAG: hypothetical protein EP315_03710 [Gammaproteobacteria bacterium]